eukprot:Tamp_07602.p1 GENE.Tamp_07602~~Tamp_07602.p1  ORF type:complete len:361 (+),score=43.31 Tamp_07602:637-1719(+)
MQVQHKATQSGDRARGTQRDTSIPHAATPPRRRRTVDGNHGIHEDIEHTSRELWWADLRSHLRSLGLVSTRTMQLGRMVPVLMLAVQLGIVPAGGAAAESAFAPPSYSTSAKLPGRPMCARLGRGQRLLGRFTHRWATQNRLRCQSGGNDAEVTAAEALKRWQQARHLHAHTLKFGVGTSRRYVSLLIVSEQCVRALLVEKKMQQLLPAFFDSANEGNNGELESRATDRKSEWELRATEKKSDRLLVLSAGLRNLPGAAVPKSLLIAAAERGIDLTDDNPRAAFDAEDLEYFDFILCVDGEVRDKLLQMAALRAGGSDRVADPDVFSASSFVPSSASASASSSSSLTERLSYEEYERRKF